MPDHDDLASDDYDEFQFLPFHAEWAGLPWPPPVSPHRDAVSTSGRGISFLRWGPEPPELVLLHGSGQNAHTWDTFALALGSACVALDLPGHGRSDWRPDGGYFPHDTADDVAAAIGHVAPRARALVGMSLGGLTALRVAAVRPELCRALVLVDITPTRPAFATQPAPPPGSLALLAGPRRFATWDAMLDATHATMPHRRRETLLPGLRHNARRFEDGTWGWRYDQLRGDERTTDLMATLWDDLEQLDAPVTLVRGSASTVLTDDAVSELRRRRPDAAVHEITGAGHSVQSDQPVALAEIVRAVLS